MDFAESVRKAQAAAARAEEDAKLKAREDAAVAARMQDEAQRKKLERVAYGTSLLSIARRLSMALKSKPYAFEFHLRVDIYRGYQKRGVSNEQLVERHEMQAWRLSCDVKPPHIAVSETHQHGDVYGCSYVMNCLNSDGRIMRVSGIVPAKDRHSVEPPPLSVVNTQLRTEPGYSRLGGFWRGPWDANMAFLDPEHLDETIKHGLVMLAARSKIDPSLFEQR
ncbi:hypothetical protein Cs7R123_47740 [Catellatospora sp. TT07R-123]|uniref:hypothetical protein n=1 Tax=Catellatospora sp. TT07R-123 TaxID=2733863 RepID=UPI001B1BA44F|nr:hypothetical protein [Catellatospora sp. TT07R-123]GHJ47432.1 hypothetical protein Cs7R123_47740 [Catellatospora sp. TT07R-123]